MTTTQVATYQTSSTKGQEALRDGLLGYAKTRNFEGIKGLINMGVPVGIQDDDGWTALHFLSVGFCYLRREEDANHRMEIVKYLVHECCIDINTRNNEGCTALLLAISDEGNFYVIQYLIYECPTIDVHIQNNIGENALHLLLSSAEFLYYDIVDGYVDIIKYLIKQCKVNIYAIDNDGMNALHHACDNGHIDIVKYLIDECRMDNIHQQDNAGRNALHYAVINGHYEITQYLIDDGRINADLFDHKGYNVLHYTLEEEGFLGSQQCKIVQSLLENSHADLTMTTRDGKNIFDIVYNGNVYVDIELIVLLVMQLMANYI